VFFFSSSFVNSYNEQLTQSLQKAEKDLKHIEEKHHKQLNENRTLHLNEINEYKRHIQQLENENEQLKREDIVHVEPPTTTTTDIQTITINNEEREQLENEIQKLNDNIDEYKKKIENLTQQQLKENELKQEIDEYEIIIFPRKK